MQKRKKVILLALFGIFLAVSFNLISATYTSSNPALVYSPSSQTGGFLSGGNVPFAFDQSMCRNGQDFLLQIDPLGCSPSVVRSDLLADQTTAVFCPIIATQLNPLIKIDVINNIVFSFNGSVPKGVQGVTFMPARAALATPQIQNNQPIFNNIGYAVIILSKQVNESALPDFIAGNLTASLRYNIQSAYGVGQSSYYLPELSEADWQERYTQYGFWKGRGYLRADSVSNDGAVISLYSDTSYPASSSTAKTKSASFNLKVGQTSSEIPMPGFNYCFGTMSLKLNSVQNPDTRARLTVNGDTFELTKGEKFIDNKCTVKDIQKFGLLQRVSTSCRTDTGTNTFNFGISPRIKLAVDGKEIEAGLGDRIFTYQDTSGSSPVTKSVYLAYEDSRSGIGSLKDLNLTFISQSGNSENLSQSTLNSQMSILKPALNVIGKLLQGKSYDYVDSNGERTIFTKSVKIVDFAEAVDTDFSGIQSLDDFNSLKSNANTDYNSVMNTYTQYDFPEKGSDAQASQTLGEEALRQQITFLASIAQKKSAKSLCTQFTGSYPNAEVPSVCADLEKLSSTETSETTVSIGGTAYIISLEGIVEPTFDDFGAIVSVTDSSGAVNTFELTKNQVITINDATKEFIELTDLTETSAKISFNLKRQGQINSNSASATLQLDSSDTLNSAYTFRVQKINLKKVASVSVNPKINFAQTNANFAFRIGIEKRGIQLTPNQTRDRIESLNETIKKLDTINNQLSSIVKAGNTACLATGAFLTLKNFLSNFEGAGIARQKVMTSSGGWADICQSAVNNKQYPSVDACLLDNNDKINSQVDEVTNAMNAQNEKFKQLDSKFSKSSILGENAVDTQAELKEYVSQAYIDNLKSNLTAANVKTLNIQGQANPISVSDITSTRINSDTLTLTQARDIELNSELLNSQDPVLKQIAQNQITSELTTVWTNTDTLAQLTDLGNVLGVSPDKINFLITKDSKEEPYTGLTYKDIQSKVNLPGVSSTTPIAIIPTSEGKKYIATLSQVGDFYTISALFDINGNAASQAEKDSLRIHFRYYSPGTYNNPYTPESSATIQYYETDPYKGLPAIIPFDLKNGWYVSIKSTTSIGGSIKPYDASGRVSSFYLCNIGDNHRQDGIDGDVCEQINPAISQPPVFSGLDPNTVSKIENAAINAIEKASRARQSNPNVASVVIISPTGASQTIKVGQPAAESPAIQCQDFMSPSDCNLLFNVCDPFVCPSSRCDLGGAYPVKDVVQSGVIGGLLLCAPNYPEVKIPVCVSAVSSGIDGYVSVLHSYQQCLQTSLDTGQTVGICDEINSVYMCDFFWRQALPIANIAIPKAIGSVVGQGTSGGGEYMSVKDAWGKASDSIDYFKQYYASSSYNAFKARTTADAGTEICKNWVSLNAPSGGNIIDSLTAPASPVQFYGRFDEIPYTTATNPPTSQYKVFYQIYAGKDAPAYYQVYLKGTSGSYFNDAGVSYPVANGFIPQGQSGSDTKDFTAPTGYSQLCIVVNGQEQCDFKQVTTDFGANYVSQQFVASQASQTDIKTEQGCVSGTANIYSLINSGPNAQSAAESAVDPAIYNRGITRICATLNPGQATDPARWKSVGYCGNSNVQCWLDLQSVNSTIKDTNIQNEVIQGVTQDTVTAIQQSQQTGGYLSIPQSSDFVQQVKTINNPTDQVTLINSKINNIPQPTTIGYLTLLRGNAYALLAERIFNEKIRPSLQPKIVAQSEQPANTGTGTGTGGVTDITLRCSNCGDGLTNICDQQECKDISTSSGRNCIFSGINSCTEAVISGDTQGAKFSSPMLEFKDGSLKSKLPFISYNPYYEFTSDGIWIYSQDRKTWTASDVLSGRDYNSGLLALIQTTQSNDGSTLLTDSVQYSSNEIYTVNKDKTIELRYNAATSVREWQFFDGSNWISVSTNLPNAVSSEFNSKLAGSLVGKGEVDGAQIIFSVDSPAGFSSNAVSTSTDANTNTQTSTQTSIETCNTKEECEKVLGTEVIKLSQAKKTSDSKFSDAVIQKDTGGAAKNFECLTLMLAMQESDISQCNPIQQNGNSLYCNGNPSTVVGGDSSQGGSIGILEINKAAHPDAFSGASPNNAYYFDYNVNYGLDLLTKGYSSQQNVYKCHQQTSETVLNDGDFVSTTYSGWKAALRNYNGWNSQCWCYTNSDGQCVSQNTGVTKALGNPNYVEQVLGESRDKVVALFPECA